MYDPGFSRPDFCSIRAADGEADPAGSVRGLLSTDGRPLAGDDPPSPLARDADRTLPEAGILRALEHSGGPGGTAALWPVIGCRGQRTGAGR